MNLYKLSQKKNNGYDTYDSCIVAAEDQETARYIHPSEYEKEGWWNKKHQGTWAHPSDIQVEQIGTTLKDTPKGVILASFNAG